MKLLQKMLLLPLCAPFREPTKLGQSLLDFCHQFNLMKNFKLHNKAVQTTWFKPKGPAKEILLSQFPTVPLSFNITVSRIALFFLFSLSFLDSYSISLALCNMRLKVRIQEERLPSIVLQILPSATEECVAPCRVWQASPGSLEHTLQDGQCRFSWAHAQPLGL